MRLNACRGGMGAPTQGGARWTNYAVCSTCGKRIAITKAGYLRTHGTRTTKETK